MGKRFKEIEIDKNTYIFTMLEPRISTKLLIRLVKIVGPSIGKAFPGEIKLKQVFDMDINIGDAVVTLCNRLDEDEVQDIINILCTQIQHKGEGVLSQAGVYTNLFSGRIKHLFNVVKNALEVQYADFFDGKEGLEDFLKTAQKMSKENQK